MRRVRSCMLRSSIRQLSGWKKRVMELRCWITGNEPRLSYVNGLIVKRIAYRIIAQRIVNIYTCACILRSGLRLGLAFCLMFCSIEIPKCFENIMFALFITWNEYMWACALRSSLQRQYVLAKAAFVHEDFLLLDLLDENISHPLNHTEHSVLAHQFWLFPSELDPSPYLSCRPKQGRGELMPEPMFQ